MANAIILLSLARAAKTRAVNPTWTRHKPSSAPAMRSRIYLLDGVPHSNNTATTEKAPSADEGRTTRFRHPHVKVRQQTLPSDWHGNQSSSQEAMPSQGSVNRGKRTHQTPQIRTTYLCILPALGHALLQCLQRLLRPCCVVLHTRQCAQCGRVLLGRGRVRQRGRGQLKGLDQRSAARLPPPSVPQGEAVQPPSSGRRLPQHGTWNRRRPGLMPALRKLLDIPQPVTVLLCCAFSLVPIRSKQSPKVSIWESPLTCLQHLLIRRQHPSNTFAGMLHVLNCYREESFPHLRPAASRTPAPPRHTAPQLRAPAPG
jgi:hypothetical protein